jgi:hypothetical protein
LVTGFAFKRVIDSMTRARWLSFRLAETLTLEDDGCAVLARVRGFALENSDFEIF